MLHDINKIRDPYIGKKIFRGSGSMRVRVASSGDDLEDKDTVAKDVRFGREDAVQGVLRRHVPAVSRKHTTHQKSSGVRLEFDPMHFGDWRCQSTVHLLCSSNAAGVSYTGVDAE